MVVARSSKTSVRLDQTIQRRTAEECNFIRDWYSIDTETSAYRVSIPLSVSWQFIRFAELYVKYHDLRVSSIEILCYLNSLFVPFDISVLSSWVLRQRPPSCWTVGPPLLHKERYPDPPCWGGAMIVGATSTFHENSFASKPRQRGGHGPKMVQAPWKKIRVRISWHIVWWNCSDVAVAIFQSLWRRSPFRAMIGLFGVFSYRRSSVLWTFVFDVFTCIPRTAV